MKRYVLDSLKWMIFLTLICGMLYPFFVTGLASALFPDEARGRLIRSKDGNVVGSGLMGQKFTSERYFHGRPSSVDYVTVPSGASHLSPTSTSLMETIRERSKSDVDSASVPAELLMASGSGLDPHLTEEGALFQTKRIALARGVPEVKIRELVDRQVFGQNPFLPSERLVNVLLLNLSLDESFNP
jgi:K+-transporting ATPase ATPase C chain